MTTPSDVERVRPLIALRVSDDLTVAESTRVDQLAREVAEVRDELAAMDDVLQTLRTAASEPCPTDDRPSLWSRIEPQLGPAGRMARPRRPYLATPHLVAAAGLMLALTITVETTRYQRQRLAVGAAAVRRPQGEVGVASTFASPFGSRQAMGVFEPARPNAVGGRTVELPAWGVTVRRVRASDLRNQGLPVVAGVSVMGVAEESVAHSAGLLPRDILIFVDGRKILCPTDLCEALQEDRGGKYMVEVLRDGRPLRVELLLSQPKPATSNEADAQPAAEEDQTASQVLRVPVRPPLRATTLTEAYRLTRSQAI